MLFFTSAVQNMIRLLCKRDKSPIIHHCQLSKEKKGWVCSGYNKPHYLIPAENQEPVENWKAHSTLVTH